MYKRNCTYEIGVQSVLLLFQFNNCLCKLKQKTPKQQKQAKYCIQMTKGNKSNQQLNKTKRKYQNKRGRVEHRERNGTKTKKK